MKLFNYLFIVALKKKYSGEAALCSGHFIVFLKSNSVTTSFNLSKFFIAGFNNKKKKKINTYKLMIDLSFV